MGERIIDIGRVLRGSGTYIRPCVDVSTVHVCLQDFFSGEGEGKGTVAQRPTYDQGVQGAKSLEAYPFFKNILKSHTKP